MSPRSDARERYIEAAARLFRRRGYHGVGVAEIVAESAAPRGSFYHHFPGGKEELALHAVDAAGRFVARLIDEAFDGAPDREAGRRALGERLAGALEASGWVDGCPVTGIVSDAAGESDALRQAVADTFERWTARVAGHAARLGDGKREARRFAERLLVEMEGAWIVARVTRSRAPFEAAGER